MLGFLGSLFGCDLAIDTLKPGVSTGDEVRKVLGNPSAEWKEADGSVTWEFTRQPEGVVTYMTVIGSDGVLRELRQVLADEYFARIRPGMTKDEVRRVLGTPRSQVPLPLKREEVWSWQFEPQHGSRWLFNVHFDLAGRVRTTSRQPNDTAA